MLDSLASEFIYSETNTHTHEFINYIYNFCETDFDSVGISFLFAITILLLQKLSPLN